MNTAYFSEKQLKRRKFIFKLKIYGGLLVFCALIIGFLYSAIYSPIFKAVKIEIAPDVGSAEIEQDNKIVEDFKIFILSQSKLALILGADNIISWAGDFDIKKFLGENPLIDDLQVEKDYFSKKIIFKIKKRGKFGIWCVAECWWFDRSGKIFGKAPKTEGEMIYKVNDFSNRQLIIGSRAIEKKIFDNLLKIFDVIEQVGLDIKTIYLKDFDLQEISVESPGLPKIYFSLRFDPLFALSAIEKLKKEGIFNKIKYIDFRVENRVYYSL